MSETIYPIPIEQFNSALEVGMGKCYPAFTESHGKGKCTNCKDPDGLLYYLKISQKGPIKFLTDGYGNTEEVHARLFSVSCPVCRPTAEAPAPHTMESEESEEGDEWWNV